MGNYRDLRDWLSKVEDMGELIAIKEEVDWNEELTAINIWLARKKVAPL